MLDLSNVDSTQPRSHANTLTDLVVPEYSTQLLHQVCLGLHAVHINS